MRSLFLDSSVLLLAVGADHPRRAACHSLVTAASRGICRLHLSVEGGQEYLFHRLRRVDRQRAVAEFDSLDAMVVWHPFDADVLRLSASLVRDGHARGRDAVHAATALHGGFTQIVSCDADFDRVPGLRRLDPQGLRLD